MEIVTSWYTLIQYAKELAEAEKSKDAEKIAIAKNKHDNYREMCLKSDRISLNIPKGFL
jgi:hypothetical protein